MQIETIDLGAASRISLEGRLDTRTVDQIGTRFTASAVAPGKNAIIDLSAVSFVSSMGIRLLLESARSLALKKAKLVVFGAQPLVMHSFETIGLGELISIAADETEALALLEPA